MITMVLSIFTMKAPEAPFTFIVMEEEPLYPYGIDDPMLRTFVKVESNFNEYAINPVSGARGILQILPIMIKEANRIIKQEKYTWDDTFSAEKSIEIWYIAQKHHNPNYTIEKACQVWFGKGVQYNGWTWVDYHYSIVKNGGTSTFI